MAGQARRLDPMPFSKELYPVGTRVVDGQPRLEVVSHRLLDQMLVAGVDRAFLVIRDGKWDIPAYYKDGARRVGMPLAYLLARLPYGLPFSLDTARPFTGDSLVAMGFPDILLRPRDALARVVERLRKTEADVVLGLFPWRLPQANDMVEVGRDGRVTAYVPAGHATDLEFTWALMAWGPRFADFLHVQTEAWLSGHGEQQSEYLIGSIMSSALSAGLAIQGVAFRGGAMLDVGTHQGLRGIRTWQASQTDGTGASGEP